MLDRVVAIRRSAPPEATDQEPSPEPEDLQGEELVSSLRERVERLEQEFEAFQDAVHRESRRRDEEIAELRRQLQPQAIARSLSEDARRRGL